MAEESSSKPRRSQHSKDKKWPCPLCSKGYDDARSLRRHVLAKHPKEKDYPDVISATKSRDDRREECPHCSKTFVALRKHIKICPMNPQRIPEDPQESSRKLPQKRSLDQLSNVEFLMFYKEKLQKSVQPSTVSAYVSALKKIIRWEEANDETFRTAHWFVHPINNPNHRFLRPLSEYMPPAPKNSASLVKHLHALYNQLHSFIEGEMARHTMDPIALHRQSLGDAKGIQRKLRRGEYPKRQPKNKDDDSDGASQTSDEDERVDPLLTARVLQAYLDSRQRKEALDSPPDSLEPGQERLFLAMEAIVRSQGSRIDVIRNLQAHDIVHARHELVKCPYCGEIVTWKDHRALCAPSNPNPGFEEPRELSFPKWRIKCGNHKTGLKGNRPVYLIWSDSFRQKVLDFVSRHGIHNREQPFAGIDWSKVKSLFWKMVDDPALLQSTKGKFGAREFRRMEIQKVLTSNASNEEVKAKLRGIGTSAVMGQRNYLNERYKSYLRGETHKETEYDPRPELPGLSREETVAPSSSSSSSDDEEVQVRTFKNPFYRSPSSNRNATEVSDI